MKKNNIVWLKGKTIKGVLTLHLLCLGLSTYFIHLEKKFKWCPLFWGHAFSNGHSEQEAKDTARDL